MVGRGPELEKLAKRASGSSFRQTKKEGPIRNYIFALRMSWKIESMFRMLRECTFQKQSTRCTDSEEGIFCSTKDRVSNWSVAPRCSRRSCPMYAFKIR